MVGGDAIVVFCVRLENPGALPPFPAWERVLAIEIGDARRTPHSTTCGEGVDEVTKSMIKGAGFAMPDFALKETVSWCIFCFFGIFLICERALANPSCIA